MNYLNPNSILQLSNFVHLCEAFLGIPPSIHLFRYFFKLKTHPDVANPDVVGGAEFQFRIGQKIEYLTYTLKDSNKKWSSRWFYSGNALSSMEIHSTEPPWGNPFWDHENLTMEDFHVIRPHIA